MNVIEDKHPRNIWEVTPFHAAAMFGHFEICKYILEHTEEKNPRGYMGFTPLHTAALFCHQEICGLIRKNIENKNPQDDFGITPKICFRFGIVAGFYMGTAELLEKLFTKKRDKITILCQKLFQTFFPSKVLTLTDFEHLILLLSDVTKVW